MNKARRKSLHDIIKLLCSIQMKSDQNSNDIMSALDNAYDRIESIYSDEENYMENMPENLQCGYRYEKAEEACVNLENAMDSVDEAKENVDNNEELMSCIESAIGYLNNATA